MSLYITSLNSGSNGNCYYIGNDEEGIFVDAGISCRETEKRMKRLGLSMDKVKAIFVSHEHSDHISGIPVLAKKYRLPVYITEGTLRHGRMDLARELVIPFAAYEAVRIGGISVTAFPKFHDASDPHSFIVASSTVRVGVFTDIGKACAHVINHFQHCHAAFLETNYDEEMLMNGRYPASLKNRIKGGHGHLSNAQALELFKLYRPSFMSHLLLAHLSKDNNNPQLVKDLFDQHTSNTSIVVASRFEETAVYHIQSSGEMLGEIKRPVEPVAPAFVLSKPKRRPNDQQLSLF
ncbi:MBL fold metallo-hydrolase [Paraflavitalea soli]|uniref:MBL fold metallo-hydrolase n=1 Tax=Paraflavitalea soli TaxID=2315862 RepID=A0A3B7MVZ9_9BACT|nr:MBL fold metallo-hydrolase [Paraflavitalea soli]AXY78664.1 MBL fold metallo-hydrolase [Paraflavitalea soli]